MKGKQNTQTELMEMEVKQNGVVKSETSTEITTDKPRTELLDIHYNKEQAKDRDYLNEKLSLSPPVAWVKEHPIVKIKQKDGTFKPAKYLPVSTVQSLLRGIFQRFKTEVIDFKVIANAISVHVRLHYVDPVTGEWDYQDGLGAVAIQLDAGAAATDFTKTKSDAIMKNLPAAESYAIKNAAQKLGKIFGGDLNTDTIEFNSSYNKKETKWTQPQ